MRKAFMDQLLQEARVDASLYVITADLGFVLFDDLRRELQHRFINVGVAEANMVGIAAGLALAGKKVFCYSITPFITMRALEQVRVDVCYQNLNVRLIGVGGGFLYGLEGFTHFGLEDLAIMRSLPNMTVVAPADPLEAKLLVEALRGHEGPVYIRLGRTGEPAVHTRVPDFKIGKGLVLEEGQEVTLMAVGGMVKSAMETAEILKANHINPTLINFHTIKPLDFELIEKYALSSKAIFTLEEHNLIGGLGSAVAEFLAENSYRGIFKRWGIPEKLEGYIGDANFLREKYGLTSKLMAAGILRCLSRT